MKIKKETVTRTVLLVVALVNQILTITGHSVLPFTDEFISEWISMGFTTIVSIWSWWKNNSFTKEAIAADEYLDKLREGE